MYIYARMRAYVRICVYICAYLCLCARVRIRPYACVCVHICAYASVYVRTRRARERFELAFLSTSWPPGAETLIITTKIARMALTHCILQGFERRHAGKHFFYVVFRGCGCWRGTI